MYYFFPKNCVEDKRNDSCLNFFYCSMRMLDKKEAHYYCENILKL